MTRSALAPFAVLYRAGVAAKNLAYEQCWLKPRRLRSPVISIGNLSVGGSGKTPLTIRLAELLVADGFAVDVLSRGYGRSSQKIEQVDPSGDSEQFGDEPLLIARRAEVPIFVGASRYEAGLLSEQASRDNSVVHLVDDGFQHRQLARDVDIVVVHRSDLVEKLLPAGRLREPLSSLRRADFLAVREEDADLEWKLRNTGATAPIWWMRRALTVPSDLTGDAVKVIAFCGIARPDEFFSTLIARGVNVELAIPFADHHRYIPEDIDRLVTAAKEARAGAFITTEKDAVKLTPPFIHKLEAVAPVNVIRLEVSLRDEAAVVQQLRAKLDRQTLNARETD